MMPMLGPTELLFVVLGIASLAFPLWGIIDAAQRPDWQWTSIGASRTTWIVLMAVFAFVCTPAGLVISVYYLAAIRPRLASAADKPTGRTVDTDF
jgi:phosphoglycerol transferase MdoB-like AlkP superfamily enzyme